MIFVTCFMHVCLTIKYYKIMGGDKIVLLDGAGANGGGAATNGLLSGCSRRSSLYKMACRARLPRRKNKLEGSDLRSRSRSFRWCGSHSKKYDSRIPVFPVWKKRIKMLYRSAGNRIPVAGLFHITFFLT